MHELNIFYIAFFVFENLDRLETYILVQISLEWKTIYLVKFELYGENLWDELG